MPDSFTRFDDALSGPLVARSRLLLLALVVPLGLSLMAPLWNLRFEAPQYPAGLELEIYAYTVEGDVNEINTLNHYIGMQRIDRAALSELDWLPFGLGVLALLCLRVALIGSLRSLVDLTVLFLYFSAYSFARFVYKLYVFGHDLDPKAAITVEPFMPVILGSKQIANFFTTSLPGAGSLWMGLFGVGLVVALAWNVAAALRERRGASEPA